MEPGDNPLPIVEVPLLKPENQNLHPDDMNDSADTRTAPRVPVDVDSPADAATDQRSNNQPSAPMWEGLAAEEYWVRPYAAADEPTGARKRGGRDFFGSPASSQRRFWLRAFGFSFLIVLAMMLILGGLGIYRGLNDRRVSNKTDALAYYEQGNVLMQEGNYELAAAHYREALRLEPNFEAAAFMLVAAEEAATSPTPMPATEGGAGGISPTPPQPGATATTPSRQADIERLFEEANAALARKDWEIAAATFDVLASQAASFRSEEVAAGLFEARMQAGKAALKEEELADALRHFDHALAVRPDDAEAQQLRRLTSSYRAGLRAYEAEQWSVAADQLRVVYLSDPNFLEAESLLAQAHTELGREYAARSIWCDAAQQYRSALAVRADSTVRGLVAGAEERCEERVVAPPATFTPAPTREPVITTLTPTRGVATTIPLSGTLVTGTVTPVTTTITVTPPPVVTPRTPAATTTRAPLPTITPSNPTGGDFMLLGGVGTDHGNCGGNYIRGVVRAEDGAPIAGITIVAQDNFGNILSATSKADPLGQYDIPISAGDVTYIITVVEGNTPLSSPVRVSRGAEVDPSLSTCYLINWQRAP